MSLYMGEGWRQEEHLSVKNIITSVLSIWDTSAYTIWRKAQRRRYCSSRRKDSTNNRVHGTPPESASLVGVLS